MSNKGQLLQDPFLNLLRKEHVPVSIYLVNGIKLQGHIESFDQYVVLLRNTVTQMVYKHAISTVVPGRAVNFHAGDAPARRLILDPLSSTLSSTPRRRPPRRRAPFLWVSISVATAPPRASTRVWTNWRCWPSRRRYTRRQGHRTPPGARRRAVRGFRQGRRDQAARAGPPGRTWRAVRPGHLAGSATQP